MTPQRIQLKRVKGWKMPPNTVKVARPYEEEGGEKVSLWAFYDVERDGSEWSVKLEELTFDELTAIYLRLLDESEAVLQHAQAMEKYIDSIVEKGNKEVAK